MDAKSSQQLLDPELDRYVIKDDLDLDALIGADSCVVTNESIVSIRRPIGDDSMMKKKKSIDVDKLTEPKTKKARKSEAGGNKKEKLSRKSR